MLDAFKAIVFQILEKFRSRQAEFAAEVSGTPSALVRVLVSG